MVEARTVGKTRLDRDGAGPMPETFSFCVAGIEVLLRAQGQQGLRALEGFYEAYPGGRASPQLIIDFQYDEHFTPSLAVTADFPQFSCSTDDAGQLHLWRDDTEGGFTFPTHPGFPITGCFVGRCTTNSLEAAIRVGVALTAVRRGGLLVHASAICMHDRAFVFAGVSGAGKSTISQMLADNVPGITKIADELLLLLPTESGWRVSIGPFLGGKGLPHGTSYPLGAIHYLR